MRRLGVELHVRDATRAMLGYVPAPRFGWGRHLNPCLDCRAYFLRVAREMMDDLGAAYVVTGEVLGQRPMSQHREAMARIEKTVGLERMVLRPLTAHRLEPTAPEERGWVDRARLRGIQGRSRSEQNRLAREWQLEGFTTPAGGCLLTDPQFAWKLEDLLNWEELTPFDAHLLKFGRHFRLDDRTRAVVGRDERENRAILTYRRPGDWILVAAAGRSPETLLRGPPSEANLALAARLTARYSAHREEDEVEVLAHPAAPTLPAGSAAAGAGDPRRLRVRPATREDIDRTAIRRREKAKDA
jgi:hypothetical protein